ncbi:hypothetical protein [Hyalangium rubrum]|uniref:DUF4375 domain-containing protein n=1 Tax=Hyalangium rubrum TaxID=3103134 RepID=A0ABU5GYK5_9BACT|nr:hypothetical protein [Hyalangium sp. s54d21]MDY7226281.1 hypothetical protein [Hyalangium sp. s54d21]
MKKPRPGKSTPNLPSPSSEGELRELASRLADMDDNALDAQLLVTFREARDNGTVPADAGFFLVAHILLAMADEAIAEDAQVLELGRELEKMEQDYGLLEDAAWGSGEAPEEWEALCRQYDIACDEARATFFREYGEQEMAELFLHDRASFIRRFENGRGFFHGLPMAPDFLN